MAAAPARPPCTRGGAGQAQGDAAATEDVSLLRTSLLTASLAEEKCWHGGEALSLHRHSMGAGEETKTPKKSTWLPSQRPPEELSINSPFLTHACAGKDLLFYMGGGGGGGRCPNPAHAMSQTRLHPSRHSWGNAGKEGKGDG